MKEVKTIVIVGGGTAGWATAHQFLNKTSPDTKVIVVSTKEIPIIGVGESTTGTFRSLINLENNVTGLNEKEFLKETKSTFKVGIKHSDWHTIGEHFYSPLGDDYHNDTNYPIHNYDDYRIYHIANNLTYNNTFQSQLMNKNKLPIIENEFVQNKNIAYHLDTYKVGQYLKRKALDCKERCIFVEGKVVNTVLDENGYLKEIITEDNQKVSGDLFIDCSGFSKLLMKNFDNKWISYKDNLLVNRAMPFYVENKEEEPIRNYTHAWAQKNGWLWEIPTQERLGCGYVYSDNHTTPEKSQEEIEKVLGHKIEPLNDIKFETGRFEKFWIKNVLSTGLSSAFIEPLEATSIHATTMQITHFIENYFKKNMPFDCVDLHKQYNKEMTSMWDDIRDFIVYHYISPRKDTQFWIDASDEERRSEELKSMINTWKYRMPRTVDYNKRSTENFYSLGNTLWYHIGIGMKNFSSELAKQELEDYQLLNYNNEKFIQINKKVNETVPNCVYGNDYYASL